MKKIFLSAIALMALGTAASAQDINFGVKAGVNFATIASDDDDGAGARTGFHVGALAEFKLSETFAIQPELIYSMQGNEVEVMGEDFGAELSYLNLPIMAKYYVIEGLSLEAGPQVGFLLSAESDGEDTKDFYKSVDFGINAGAGYELPMGLFFQARYYVGLSDINDIPDDVEDEIGESSANNYVFALSVGYKF